jgi:hypothetical protein
MLLPSHRELSQGRANMAALPFALDGPALPRSSRTHLTEVACPHR